MAKQGEQAKRGPVEAAALFPRLHVSHVKRDNGPRPPPRNKMALYEQVTLQSKVAKAAAGTSSQQQDEATGGSGMQAPKARTQTGGSLPSTSSFGSRYDYPQHSTPYPAHLQQNSFSSAPSYYQQQSTFQNRSMTSSQGTGLRLPSGASSVGSASEWDANETQTAHPYLSNRQSQIVPGGAAAGQPSEAPSRVARPEEEEGCLVPSFQSQALSAPRVNPAPMQDASGRWAWWSWQQQQATIRSQMQGRPQEGPSVSNNVELEEQSRQRALWPPPQRASTYSGQRIAEPAYASSDYSRKVAESESSPVSVRKDVPLGFASNSSEGSGQAKAQRLALQKQAAADWKTAAEAGSVGDRASSGRHIEVVAQQSEASEHQAALDSKGVASEVVAAAERRAGAVRAQEEVAAQIKAAIELQSGSPEQGLVPVLDADVQQEGGGEKARRLLLKPTLSIEVPKLSTQAGLEGSPLGEPEGSITQEVASGSAELAAAEPAPSVNMPSTVHAASEGSPKPRQHYKAHYAFHRHFPQAIPPPPQKGNGDSSPEVIEGSEGGAFKDVTGGQKGGKGAEGQVHFKGRKRASAQANKATQEAAAAVAAKAGPSPSGSSSGDRSGGAGALSEQDAPSVCDVEDTGADSRGAAGIMPKDVVSVIGQHGFWKSRKAMQQQQQKFSAQLFEMHRLVKVQKMFADNPNLTRDPTPLTPPKRLHPRDVPRPAPPPAAERSTLSDPLRYGPFAIPQGSGSVSHADAFKAAKTTEFSNPGSRGYVASKVAQLSSQYGPRDAVLAAQEAARLSFQEVSSAPANVQAAEALALVAQRVGESCSKLMAHRESEKSGPLSPQGEDSGAQVVLEEATRLSATLEAMRPHLPGGGAPAVPNPWMQPPLAAPYGAYYPQMSAFAANPYMNPAAYMRQAQSMMAAYPAYNSSAASFYGGEAMSAPTRGNPYSSGAGFPMYPKYTETAGAAALNPALNPWMQSADPMTAAWLATIAGGASPWGFPNAASLPAGFPTAAGVYPTPANPGGFPAAANPLGPSPSQSSQSMSFRSSWNSFRGLGDEFSSWVDKGGYSGTGDAFAYDQFRPRSSHGPGEREGPTRSFSGLSHSWAGGPLGSGANTRLNGPSQSSDAQADSRTVDWSEQTFGRGSQDRGFSGLGKRKETENTPRWQGWQQPQMQDLRGGGRSEDSLREARSELTHMGGSFLGQANRMKGGGNDSEEDALHVEEAAQNRELWAASQPGGAYSSPKLSDRERSRGVNELQLFPVKSGVEKKPAAAPIKVVPRAASETPDLGVSILASIQRER